VLVNSIKMLNFSNEIKYKLICVIFLNFIGMKCEDFKVTKISTTASSIIESSKSIKVPCETHANCSSRILTLDTYCCPTSNHCCNWFKFAVTYKPELDIPLKAPSILTILAILLLIICFLFVCYCFSILFCFCFKCGIFKKPKVIVISHLNNSESGLFNGCNSPKHSTSTTSSASSNSSYSSHRRQQRHNSSHKNYKKKTYSKHRNHRSGRSPTARAYSNKRPQYDSEIYVDFDANQNESPFLIPPELNEHVQQRVNRSLNAQQENLNHSSRRNNSSSYRNNSNNNEVSPSAPMATDDLLSEIIEVDNTPNIVSNRQSNSILEPVLASSLSASTTSSLGLDGVTTSNNETEITNITNSTTNVTHTPNVIQSYQYHDEKPPAYEDIIKRNY